MSYEFCIMRRSLLKLKIQKHSCVSCVHVCVLRYVAKHFYAFNSGLTSSVLEGSLLNPQLACKAPRWALFSSISQPDLEETVYVSLPFDLPVACVCCIVSCEHGMQWLKYMIF